MEVLLTTGISVIRQCVSREARTCTAGIFYI